MLLSHNTLGTKDGLSDFSHLDELLDGDAQGLGRAHSTAMRKPLVTIGIYVEYFECMF